MSPQGNEAGPLRKVWGQGDFVGVRLGVRFSMCLNRRSGIPLGSAGIPLGSDLAGIPLGSDLVFGFRWE